MNLSIDLFYKLQELDGSVAPAAFADDEPRGDTERGHSEVSFTGFGPKAAGAGR